MQIANMQNKAITLSLSHEEMQILEIALRAGKVTDPIIRQTSDDESAEAHQKIAALLRQMKGNEILLSLSKQDLLNIHSIVEAVNTMDPEIYYADMLEEFPSDDDLDGFTQRMSEISDQAFKP